MSGVRLRAVALDLGVPDAFLHVALRLVPLAAELGRLVATELAGLFLYLALGLVALAFDLVLHGSSLLAPTTGTRLMGPQVPCRWRVGATIPLRLRNAVVTALTQGRQHALLPLEDVSRDLAQPVREVGTELERVGLDRGAIALVGRWPSREQVVRLGLVVGHLHAEDLEQLARRVHRAAVAPILRLVHRYLPGLAPVCRS